MCGSSNTPLALLSDCIERNDADCWHVVLWLLTVTDVVLRVVWLLWLLLELLVDVGSYDENMVIHMIVVAGGHPNITDMVTKLCHDKNPLDIVLPYRLMQLPSCRMLRINWSSMVPPSPCSCNLLVWCHLSCWPTYIRWSAYPCLVMVKPWLDLSELDYLYTYILHINVKMSYVSIYI